jgi:hypothetical protein
MGSRRRRDGPHTDLSDAARPPMNWSYRLEDIGLSSYNSLPSKKPLEGVALCRNPHSIRPATYPQGGAIRSRSGLSPLGVNGCRPTQSSETEFQTSGVGIAYVPIGAYALRGTARSPCGTECFRANDQAPNSSNAFSMFGATCCHEGQSSQSAGRLIGQRFNASWDLKCRLG